MKRKKHTPEEIVRKLRQAEALIAGGKSIEAACNELIKPVFLRRRNWRAVRRCQGGECSAP